MKSTRKVVIEKLNRSIQICEMHIDRIEFAQTGIENLFPLKTDIYNSLSDNDIQAIDQFIFRFSKLQDEIGTKTFRLLLECLEENIQEKPFIDILGLLERYGVIVDEEDWLVFRELRNELTHEYPQMEDEIIESLNALYRNIEGIKSIFNQVKVLANKYDLLLP